MTVVALDVVYGSNLLEIEAIRACLQDPMQLEVKCVQIFCDKFVSS